MDAARLTAFGPGAGSGRPLDLLAPLPRTAARVEQGRIRHASAHLDRLAAAAAALGEPAPWLPDLGNALEAWVSAASDAPLEALRLRLQGDQVWAQLEPMPETPSPYRLRPMPHPLGDPARHPLAPHKGLTGPWGAETLRKAQAGGADDALLAWPDGTLVETALATILLEVEGECWLPPLQGRVASLAERLDVPAWAGDRPLRIHPFRVGDLTRGTLWCFNAVRGVWPATPL